jgi:hypothetical protein
MHRKYHIKDGEQFNADNYPMVTSQLIALREELAEIPAENKVSIVLSYLKNHSIRKDWINSNPKLTDKMISGSLAVSQIEAVFDSCKGNMIFLNEFENFIKMQFQKNRVK